MKKTLIAAGIAAVIAAPAAFAEVKIGGGVEMNFDQVDDADTTGRATDADSDNYISFSASEDLGNGLTAFAKIVLDTDNTAAQDTKDEIVGLKGGFGTIVAGRMEDFTEGKLMARMTLEGDGGAGGGMVENGSGQSNAGRTPDGLAYITPTVNGFHAAVATYNDDAQDYAIFYDNGPISVAVSHEVQKPSMGWSTTNDQKTTVITGSYTMGDLKMTVLRHSVDNNDGTAANDSDDMLYRIDYKMGANSISVAYNDDEEETTAGQDGSDIWAVEVAHNFSKQTKVYAGYVDEDDNKALSGDTSSERVYAGLKVKF